MAALGVTEAEYALLTATVLLCSGDWLSMPDILLYEKQNVFINTFLIHITQYFFINKDTFYLLIIFLQECLNISSSLPR